MSSNNNYAQTITMLKQQNKTFYVNWAFKGRKAGHPVSYWALCGCSDPQGKPTCGRTGREQAL